MSAQHTAVILLGGSRFPHLDSVEPSDALRNSSSRFKEYIENHFEGFHCSQGFMLDLFDSDDPAYRQLEDIHQFICQFTKKTAMVDKFAIRNLIIHYAGHGLILGDDGEFGLAVNYTKSEILTPTCMSMGQFAETIKSPARFMRKFIIIDCCFAGNIIKTWLPGDSPSSLAQIVQRETTNEFKAEGVSGNEEVPRRGTAVLCAADKDSVAIGAHPSGTTLFTGALLDALTRQGRKELYSLQEIYDLTWQCIQESEHNVRPVVFSPDQREGDIARLPFFPGRTDKLQVAAAAFDPPKQKMSLPAVDSTNTVERGLFSISVNWLMRRVKREKKSHLRKRIGRWRWIRLPLQIFPLVLVVGGIIGIRSDKALDEIYNAEKAPVAKLVGVKPDDLNFGRISYKFDGRMKMDTYAEFISYDESSNVLKFNYKYYAASAFEGETIPVVIDDYQALLEVELGKLEISTDPLSILLDCKGYESCINFLTVNGRCPVSMYASAGHCMASIISIYTEEKSERLNRFITALIHYSKRQY